MCPRRTHGVLCLLLKVLTEALGGGGCATGAPRSANRQGEEQHRHTERGSHTRRDKGEHSRQGGGAQRGRRGNQNSGNRETEWRGWESVRMGGSDNKGDGLASQPRRYRVPGQPLLNRHQVGGVSRSPDGLFAQQVREPIRGRPAVRGKRTCGVRPGQCVEEQGTWASRTQKHSEAGYGRPVDRGAWTAKTVKRPRQQPAYPQYANYWAPLTRKRHTTPHSAQPQHTNDCAPRTRKRHQQEHRPQRPTESSNPTQHAKGRTGDCPGPRKGTTTRQNVTQGGGGLHYCVGVGVGIRAHEQFLQARCSLLSSVTRTCAIFSPDRSVSSGIPLRPHTRISRTRPSTTTPSPSPPSSTLRRGHRSYSISRDRTTTGSPSTTAPCGCL